MRKQRTFGNICNAVPIDSEKQPGNQPVLSDISTWTDRLGHSQLRTFTDQAGRFWLEQNSAKDSRWGKLAREGHTVAWELDSPGGSYTGRLLIDGETYSVRDATKKFLHR